MTSSAHSPAPAPPPPRAPNRITERQVEDRSLDILAAYSQRYATAANWRRLRVIGTYALALLTPLLSLLWPGQGATIGAVAAAWLVVGRTVFTFVEQTYSTRAANLQELLDTELFGLPWNAAVASRHDRVVEDFVEASPYRRKPKHRDWYTTDDALPWPTDALLCQLQNVTWGRRNHKAYLPYLITGGVVLVLSDTAWALARNMSVHDFLVLLFLPTAPALLDLAELILSHLKHSDAKGRVEDNIRELLQRHIDGETLDPDECRRVQDAIYQLRCTGPRIPGWFYGRHQVTDQNVTAASAEDLSRQILAASPSGQLP